MSPITALPGGPTDGTPCGCTQAGITPLQAAILANNPTYGICGSKNFTGGPDPTLTTGVQTGIAKCYNNECKGFQTNATATGQYANLGSVAAFLEPNPFSIEIWGQIGAAQIQPAATIYPVAMQYDNGTTRPEWYMTWSSGTLDCNFWTGGATQVVQGNPTPAGTCFQFVATCAQPGAVAYQNGLQTGVNGAAYTAAAASSFNDCYLGYNPLGTFTNAQNMTLKVFLFAVYDSVLTPAQVATHWAARQ